MNPELFPTLSDVAWAKGFSLKINTDFWDWKKTITILLEYADVSLYFKTIVIPTKN